MSVKRITSVWDHSQHGGTTLLILLALADNADDNGLTWPGIELLGQRARIKKRAVINHLEKLEETEEIRIYRREGQHNYYIVRPGLTDEQEKAAIEKLAQEVGTSAETCTSQFKEAVHKYAPAPVHDHAPGGAQECTTTSAPVCTRSVIGTVSDPPDDPKDSAEPPPAVSTGEPEIPKADPPEPKPLPEHQIMFGELCEVFGYDPVNLDDEDEKDIGKVISRLRSKGAKPGQIRGEHRFLKEELGPSLGFENFTYHALPKYWKDYAATLPSEQPDQAGGESIDTKFDERFRNLDPVAAAQLTDKITLENLAKVLGVQHG